MNPGVNAWARRKGTTLPIQTEILPFFEMPPRAFLSDAGPQDTQRRPEPDTGAEQGRATGEAVV